MSLNEDKMKEIALRLMQERCGQIDPPNALEYARKLHTRVVGLGFQPDEATEFASAMLDGKIKAAISGAPSTASANSHESDLSDKLDEIFRLGGALIDQIFKKTSGNNKVDKKK